MAATGRRSFLLGIAATGLTASSLRAEVRDEIYRVLADMATDLANGLGRAFVKNFAEAMPGYAEISKNVDGMLAGDDVSASVELREVSVEGARTVVQADWYLELKSKRGIADVRQRREILRMEFAKSGKKWRVVGMRPMDFFRAD
jgi:hypothetical protein